MRLMKSYSACMCISPVLNWDCKDSFLQCGSWQLNSFERDHCCEGSHVPSRVLAMQRSLKHLVLEKHLGFSLVLQEDLLWSSS